MSQNSPDLQEVVERFADLLEACDIPYMLIGGYAVTQHVPYRDTFDGDFVVSMTDVGNIECFMSNVQDSEIFSLDEHNPRDAMAHGGKFSVFSPGYGIHVFVWRTNSSYEISDLCEDKSGLCVAVPEFIVAEKLKLVKDGDAESEDEKDITALLASPTVSLDEGTLEEFAEGYGVSDLLDKFRNVVSSTEPEDFNEIGSFGLPDNRTRVEQVAEMWKDGKSYREMADELGISQSTVGVYVGRAREQGLIPEEKR